MTESKTEYGFILFARRKDADGKMHEYQLEIAESLVENEVNAEAIGALKRAIDRRLAQ